MEKRGGGVFIQAGKGQAHKSQSGVHVQNITWLLWPPGICEIPPFIQVNVVVMRGVNDDEICDFVELTRQQPINVRFIEYMPFDGNVWSHRKMVSFKEMTHAINRCFPQGLEPLDVSPPTPHPPSFLLWV